MGFCFYDGIEGIWKNTVTVGRADHVLRMDSLKGKVPDSGVQFHWGCALSKDQINAQKLNCQDRGDPQGEFQVSGLVPEQVHSCQRAQTSAQRC